MFGRETPEQKAERKRVKERASLKAFATAIIFGFLGFVILYINLDRRDTAFDTARFAGFVIFFMTWVFAGLLFSASETAKSQKRSAQLAQQRATAQRQQEEQRKQEQERGARERMESIQATWQQENTAAEEQKRKDEREDMLKTLSGLHSFLDLYDPADKEHSIRIRQTIAEDLTALLVKYRRTELAAILEQDETLYGMVADLGEQLREKGIRSAEATQLLAALPPY